MKKLAKLNILIAMLFVLSSCGSKEDTSGLVGGGAITKSIPTQEEPAEISNPDGPIITSFIEPANGTYADGGGVLLFQVNFDEAVTVTGNPRIPIRLGLTTVYADYQTGSGTAGLEFSYAIQNGDNDSDGVSILSASINFNGGTVVSVATGETANLNFISYLDSMASVLVNTSSGITAPNQVTGVATAPTTSNTALNLTWSVPNNNGTNLINYTVQYREQGNSTWITSGTPTTNSTTVSALTAGTTYEFRVAANNGLLGAYSSVSTAQIFDVMSLDPIAWLSATDITNGGTEPSNDDKVGLWKDLTGAATDAEETTVSKQPTYKTNVQNGLPAVYFDGTIDRGLEGTFVRNNNGGLTIFLVGKFNNTARKAFFEFYQQGSPTSGASSRRGFFFTYGFGTASVNYNLDNTQFNVWSAYDTGTQSSLWENGVNKYTSINNHFGRTDFLGNGVYVLGDDQTGGDRLNGYLGEFLIFDRQLTSTEMTTIETYLKNKWGTP